MLWKKLGLVYAPKGDLSWSRSSAMVPTPIQIEDDRLRVYCSVCDNQGRARPTYVDVSIEDPCKILSESQMPLLDLGASGSFDDNGVLCTSVLKSSEPNVFYMYYVGFELYRKVRYKLFTGLAISQDRGNTFKKYSDIPILDRGRTEYCFRCGPFVIYEGNRYRMWYVAGSHWEGIAGKDMPVYDIRYIESGDGIHWPQEGRIVLAITGPDEHGFGRPWVVRENEKYHLYYSIRRKSLQTYSLGYAVSEEGISWTRNDSNMNLKFSTEGFDSHMICYSAIIRAGGKTYCFYNGNDFGKDGFAVALRVEA